ncbi:hypothetical protein M513_11837 [Trichuris suis]|uniref:Uncharacterized protein n=1 Tax=Trichuris suis TaxID=68888 RepID=A0A085LQN8_9BILA|nr:hypothetical protein M513_11837 [Trichuris suis]
MHTVFLKIRRKAARSSESENGTLGSRSQVFICVQTSFRRLGVLIGKANGMENHLQLQRRFRERTCPIAGAKSPGPDLGLDAVNRPKYFLKALSKINDQTRLSFREKKRQSLAYIELWVDKTRPPNGIPRKVIKLSRTR